MGNQDFEIDVAAVKAHDGDLMPSRFAMFKSKFGDFKDKVTDMKDKVTDKMRQFDIDNLIAPDTSDEEEEEKDVQGVARNIELDSLQDFLGKSPTTVREKKEYVHSNDTSEGEEEEDVATEIALQM